MPGNNNVYLSFSEELISISSVYFCISFRTTKSKASETFGFCWRFSPVFHFWVDLQSLSGYWLLLILANRKKQVKNYTQIKYTELYTELYTD